MADENKSASITTSVENANESAVDAVGIPIRENLVTTAVSFLQNPKVIQSPLSQKKSFLAKKGLTAEEIDIAVARANVTDVVQSAQSLSSAVPTQNGIYGSQIHSTISQTSSVSAWARLKDYMSTAVVIGGLGYLFYKIYKQYILPVWFGPSQEELHLATIEKSIKELQSCVADTLNYVKEMQASISNQQGQLESITSRNTTLQLNTTDDAVFMREVKEELKSLKGLLLSRKQFPPAPPSEPVLPMWQLPAPKPDDSVPKDAVQSISGTEQQPVHEVIDKEHNVTDLIEDSKDIVASANNYIQNGDEKTSAIMEDDLNSKKSAEESLHSNKESGTNETHC